MNLFDKLAKIKAPCDNCEHAQICRDEELSCRSFHNFVKRGTNKPTMTPPNKAVFLKIFNMKDEDELQTV